MSKPDSYNQNDKQQDKSNVQFLLCSIERIYSLCQDVLNTYAQHALMLSLAIESHMLLLKLRVMRERWQYHLPFKEACRVDFEEWSLKIKTMSHSFDTAETDEYREPVVKYCPSKHFLLDLYDVLPENASSNGYSPYYRETNVKRFLAVQEQMREEMTEKWLSHYKQHFSDYVIADLKQTESLELAHLSNDGETIAKVCRDVLSALSAELYELGDLIEPDIQTEHFSRLAERVFDETEYAGRAARKSARHDVKEWKNKTPKRKKDLTRKEEIDTSIKIISEMHYGRLLAEYIGDDYEINGHYEGLGQFLHRVRKHITKTDLADLMEQLYRIRFFRENKEQEDAAAAEKIALTSAPRARDEGPADIKIPQRPKLEHFFRKELSGDADATSLFYDILHRCERYMFGRFTDDERASLDVKMYKKWKWNHLRVAFEEAGFIEKGTEKKYFAEYLSKVFPYHSTDSIIRSVQRHSEHSRGFDDIVQEIVFEFNDIQEMIED